MRFLSSLKKILLRYEIRKASKIRIIAGAGNTKYDGWISVEKGQLNIVSENDFTYFFSNRLVDNILLEHVVEHLSYDEFLAFLKNAKKFLKKNGVIRIAVPDANHPSAYVRDLTGVNGSEPGAHDHKCFYSIDDFENIAINSGFRTNNNEYFDRDGVFHSTNYDFENGYISRCHKNYTGRFTGNSDEYNKMINTIPDHLRKQFIDFGISYTSLFVDFINE